MADCFHSRVFWESGFRTVASVANADPKDIVPVLIQVLVFIPEFVLRQC